MPIERMAEVLRGGLGDLEREGRRVDSRGRMHRLAQLCPLEETAMKNQNKPADVKKLA